jgi:bacillithiol biosynthesis cysteine-adding enzyme BshC
LNHDTVRSPAGVNAKLTSSSIPFSVLPGQSRLFLKYQSDPLSLKRFYPNAVDSAAGLLGYIPKLLASYSTDRGRLCDALTDLNMALGNSPRALDNIGRLRAGDTVAVVTGQQAGLFTGPLYTIYKALTAIKLAEFLTTRGVAAVPVFWAATEDHDLDEVSRTFFIDSDHRLTPAEHRPIDAVVGAPVGDVEIGGSIDAVIESVFNKIVPTEFTSSIRESVENAWSPGTKYGRAFELELVELLGDLGLVIIDPMLPAMKELAAPLYREAIAKADDIVTAVRERNSALIAEGYHAQVVVDEDCFPLFWHTESGTRVALTRTGDGIYTVKRKGMSLTKQYLLEIAAEQPQSLSPGVALRPIVQDYLLPTVCYVGGGAEIAYFAQNSEAYRLLDRPATPVVHRQSMTIVESKHRRTLDKFGLDLTDLFDGLDAILQKIGRDQLSESTIEHFRDAMQKLDQTFDILRVDLASIDPTLLNSLEKRQQKISYHIGSLEKKTRRAQARSVVTTERQVKEALTSLTPDGRLQERILNVNNFLNRHGRYFIDWIYGAIDVDEREHKVLYI